MKFTVDTNVLVYALDQQSPEKRAIANDILNRGQYVRMILEAQVLGEFVSAIRSKNPEGLEKALELVETWPLIFPIIYTNAEHIAAGGRLAQRHRLQFWDSVILEIARSDSVGILLTEDMQDEATIDGVTIVNPFRAENAPRVERLLSV